MTDRRPDEPLDDLLHDDVPRDPAFELDSVVEAARAAELRDRHSHGWRILLALSILLVAVIATIGALRPGWLPFDVPFQRAPSEEVTGPTVRRDTFLLNEPRDDSAALLRMPAGTLLRIVGKSPDGRWIAAAADDRPDLVGWVPADVVAGLELSGLPTVTADPKAAGAFTPPAGPTDRPDLRLESVYAKDNRLYVSVFNAGPADARGAILASVDGGAPVPLDGKSDEGLRAGQRIQAAVRGVFVQIRSAVSVVISLSPVVAETDQANNTFNGIVEPDQPTDLEIALVERGASALVVTVRNNSTIPIHGTQTITVREPLPSNRLLGRLAKEGTIDAGATLIISFPDLREVDMTDISVTLSSDSIADGALGNNTYPR